MTADPREPGGPGDPRLLELLGQAIEAVRVVDPLTMAGIGEVVTPPLADSALEAAGLARMEGIGSALEALGELAGEDELDRVALIFGLRRATAAAATPGPLGSRLMERHLLHRLSEVAAGIPGALESLHRLVAGGPGILARSRVDPGEGGAASGHLALEAARRLPAILEACAGAAAAAPAPLRFDLEAALGSLLQSAAEDSGWLLKEYIPAAAPARAPTLPDPLWAGLGYSLAELEAEAEAALAGAVGDLGEMPPPVVPPDGDPASIEDVQQQWFATAARAGARFGVALPESPVVTPAPPWLRALLPPLALLLPARASRDVLLLVGNQHAGNVADALEDLLVRDFMPGFLSGTRPARRLLPAPEMGEGWRTVMAAGAGGATEVAWRAALALAAVAMAGGRTDIDGAAGMIAAESGLSLEQARLQAIQVAERPLAALTFLAGRRALRDGLERVGEKGVAAWLAHGPLPGAALGVLAA